MMYSRMAVQTLLHQKKRYVLLFLVCVCGIFVSITAFSLMNGMLESLRNKARLYYGGDLQLLAGKSGHLSIYDSSKRIAELEALFPLDVIIAPRVEYDANTASLYFEGQGVRQRIIKGVDFNREGTLFSRFTFTEGSAQLMTDSNGILLSQPVAEVLGVQVGDSITLLLPNQQNYHNTMQLIVQGIFQDSSLFGMYTSYVDINLLRTLIGYPSDWASRIGIFYPDGAPSDSDIKVVQLKLEEIYTLFPLVDDKQLFYNAMIATPTDVPLYALITLEANLKQIQLLLDAVQAIAVLIIILLIAIIAIGIASTYKVIVHKRINEIGMYMALGMSTMRITILFLLETMWIIIFGTLGAGVLFVCVRFVLSFLNFSFIPAFDIFLEGGHLVLIPDFIGIAGILCTVIAATLIAVLVTIYKVVRINPVDALRIQE